MNPTVGGVVLFGADEVTCCGVKFTHLRDLTQHIRSAHEGLAALAVGDNTPTDDHDPGGPSSPVDLTDEVEIITVEDDDVPNSPSPRTVSTATMTYEPTLVESDRAELILLHDPDNETFDSSSLPSLQEDRGEEDFIELPFCDVCNITFETKEECLAHINTHLNDAGLSPIREEEMDWEEVMLDHQVGGSISIQQDRQSAPTDNNNCNDVEVIELSDDDEVGMYETDPLALPNDLAPEGFEEVETAFLGRLKTYRLRDEGDAANLTIPEFLVNVFDRLTELMARILSYVHGIKTNLWLDCEFSNVHGEKCRRVFKTKNTVVLRSTNLEVLCSDLFESLVAEKESCEMKGSGFAFVRTIGLEIRINVYRPLRGSSFIRLPNDIIAKRAVTNVLNSVDDNMCFKYAILSRHVNNPNRNQLRASCFTREVEAQSGLDFSCLEYPVQITKISKFEKVNNVSVNVYGLEEVHVSGYGPQARYRNIVYPLRVAKVAHPNHYDLLYLTDNVTTHYALITDFPRLVRSQLTRHTSRLDVCKRCFAHFDDQPNIRGLSRADRLAQHQQYCIEHDALRTDLTEKPYIRFERPERTQRARFGIYADFECALVPVDVDETGRDQVPPSTVQAPAWDLANQRPGLTHNPHSSSGSRRGDTSNVQSKNVTTRYIHKPYAYAYYVHDSLIDTNDGNANAHVKFRMYTGDDAADHFMRSLKHDVEIIGSVLYEQRQLRPRLSVREEADFQAATDCYLCSKPFTSPKDKVRDHQHSAPYQFRGAAHRSCNLRHKEQDVVNVYFHNLSNYDAHFVVRELGLDQGNVSVLANNEEKFITFTKRFDYPAAGRHESIGARFIDSYRFLSKGLSDLVNLLPPEKLRNTRRYFPDDEQFELVRRKGVFPYEYVNTFASLKRDSLPPKSAFYDSLRKERIKNTDYEHAKNVWDKFGCSTLEDYAKLYLKTDVLLLSDCYQAFRDMCLQHYGLDPAHYITLPSYSWDVMLRITGVVLDTIQDVDQYQFFEKGIRGGLTQVVTRNVVAENKFTRGEGDRASGREDDTFLMYFDANALYAWAMTQHLPTGGFHWLTREEIDALETKIKTEGISEDSDTGYVLEVDIEYPRDEATHTRHRDLPFLPEMCKAPVDRLPYSDDILLDFSLGKNKKLMATLMDKENYVLHYRLLQQALENGLSIRQIHRVLQFKQSAWLKPYVQLNTELRQGAKNDFEVDVFKFFSNSVYGYSIQNPRAHVDIRLATNPETYTKYVAKPNFKDRTWYRHNLAMIHMKKTHVILDKPIYVGMCILDQSKWWMYNFHYNMVDRYNVGTVAEDERIRLVYTDTDSLIYRIRTRDVYRDMAEHLDDFDTSNYPPTHMCYNPKNARMLGKFKDECKGRILKEFIGLMAKLYCVVYHPGENQSCPAPIKRAKGVNRAVVTHDLKVDDYRRCLREQAVRYTTNLRFQSKNHQIYTVCVRKRSLAPFDDKRYIIPEGDATETLPWGHYLVPESRSVTTPLPPETPVASPLSLTDETCLEFSDEEV